MNLLGDNIATVKQNTETLTDASEEVGLEENLEKAKYIYCPITRMRGKIITDPLKLWHCLNNWERQ
jgi:hypothetical protein